MKKWLIYGYSPIQYLIVRGANNAQIRLYSMPANQ